MRDSSVGIESMCMVWSEEIDKTNYSLQGARSVVSAKYSCR